MHELYGGRVGPDHAMWSWLCEHGMAEADLWWFQEHPAPLDVIGLDHYPHSEHQYRTGKRGEIVDETADADRQLGPAALARQYFDRLGRPLIFAETGAPGDDARKQWWLDRMVAQIREARGDGVPVIGITWWGLIDQVDWRHGLRHFAYDIDATGLYRLEWRDGADRPSQGPAEITPDASGYRLARIMTDTLEAWRRYTRAPLDETVGQLARSSTNAGIPLW
jgi:hypothetical protein